MSASNQAIDSAITEIDSLKKYLKKKSLRQVQSVDERGLLKATASAWFNNHRERLSFLSESFLGPIDDSFHFILSSGDKNSSRRLVQAKLKLVRGQLIGLRKEAIRGNKQPNHTTDSPPNFSPLVSDVGMQNVLIRRWNECFVCVTQGAPLAATVMIGGLIEGLLIAKVNQEPDQSKIFKAKCAPIDKKTSKPKALGDWTLSDLINLAHELGWISKPAKDIGTVLREYRNYIHPHKEYVNKISLEPRDASLFWEIAKSITRQLLGI